MNGCMSSIYLRMCNQELCRMGARRRGYEFFVVVTCDFFLDLWALLVMDVSAPRFSGWLCPGGGGAAMDGRLASSRVPLMTRSHHQLIPFFKFRCVAEHRSDSASYATQHIYIYK